MNENDFLSCCPTACCPKTRGLRAPCRSLVPLVVTPCACTFCPPSPAWRIPSWSGLTREMPFSVATREGQKRYPTLLSMPHVCRCPQVPGKPGATAGTYSFLQEAARRCFSSCFQASGGPPKIELFSSGIREIVLGN